MKGNKNPIIQNSLRSATSLELPPIHLISLSVIMDIDSSTNYFGANSYGAVHKSAITTKTQQNKLFPNSLAYTNMQLFLIQVAAGCLRLDKLGYFQLELGPRW